MTIARKRRSSRKTSQHGKARATSQEALVRALNHPLRVKALNILAGETASPKEIADHLDEPLSNISYHIRVLDELGLIELIDEESRRGAVAHYYRAIQNLSIDDSVWKSLDFNVRSAASGHIIETLIADSADSLAAGILDKRHDRHISRTPVLLDDEGWRRVSEIQKEALSAILHEQSAASARIDKSNKGTHAIVGMLFFEALPPTDR